MKVRVRIEKVPSSNVPYMRGPLDSLGVCPVVIVCR